MKTKGWALLLAGCLLFGLTACTTTQEKTGVTPKKVAVVRNLSNDDHTKQYFEGAVAQGKALGYQVDTFTTDADDEKMQDTLKQVIDGDYDGLMVSHAKQPYAQELLERAVEKGMKVVTFDTSFTQIEGVTATAQDDEQLARLSLDALLESCGEKPAKVIKVWYDEDLAPFSRRNLVYQEYEDNGLIETVAEVYPKVPASQLKAAVSAEIQKMTDIEADGIWAAWDELAKGVYDGLNHTGRTDLKMVSIDVSNEDILNMVAMPRTWVGTAAVNAKVIGQVNMRLLAKKFQGEETPNVYHLEAHLIRSDALKSDSTVGNLKGGPEGFGNSDAFLEDWMKK